MISRPSHNNHLGSAGDWRSGGYRRETKGGNQLSDSFNRLQDGSAASGEYGMPEEPWRHRAHVRGGRNTGDDAESDEFDIEDEQGIGPKSGIRVRTTVTVTEEVDWLDDLY